MWSVKIRPKPGSTSLAARSFSKVGFCVGLISKSDQAVSSILATETPMDSSPGLALRGTVAPAGSTSSLDRPQNRFPPRARCEDGLWQGAEVQYASQIGPFGIPGGSSN